MRRSLTRRVTLAVPDLVCASVIDRLRTEAPSRVRTVEFAGDARPPEVAQADGVLYVPALHLQVWRDRVIPAEANADLDSVPELMSEAAAGRIMAHALFTNVDECESPVCVLSNLYSHGFYHFIEELCKVVILERSGFTGGYAFSAFPSRIAQQVPRFARELLGMLGIAPARIVSIARPTVLRDAWFATPVALADTPRYRGVFGALRGALAAAADGPGLGPRLWMERRESRTIANPAPVRECLARHGFEIVDMAELSAAQQVAAAIGAQVLAGPHGAAFVHAMFMKEGSTVIECFSPTYNNPSVLEICSAMRHRYFQIVQTNTPLRPYLHGGNVEINCVHLDLVLQSLDRYR